MFVCRFSRAYFVPMVWAAAATFAVISFVAVAQAETRDDGVVAAAKPTKKILRNSALNVMSVFQPDFVKRSFFDENVEVHDVSNEAPVVAQKTESEKVAGAANPEDKGTQQDPKYRGPVFVDDFKPTDLLPPDQTPRIRVNKDAPAPFIGMVTAHQNGDEKLAAQYADQFVRYQQNFIFEIRELVDIIGGSLIRQGVIKDDDWDGVGQMIDYEMAKTRKETGDLLKPTQEKAMQRIKPDPGGEAEIYYFFTLNCSYCRNMASDVERLWRVTKQDPKTKMVALTLAAARLDWLAEYRNYTGMTIPMFNGEKIAKALRIRFAPVLVVVAPNSHQAYIKTGQQSFASMYEFVRRVQGLPANITPEVQQLVNTPIGDVELQRKSGNPQTVFVTSNAPNAVQVKTAKDTKIEIDRF